MTQTKKILIVDPDMDSVQEHTLLLIDNGYKVETCKGIVEATKKMERAYYDCVIMDVQLEDVKGYNAVDIIKTIDPRVEVILTASENTRELEAVVRAQDIFYYHIKSFKAEELIAAVNNLFNKELKEQKMKTDNGNPTILAIDDDPDFLNSIKIILESASYRFASACNPKEGLAMAKSENPDLILLDVMMDSLFDGFSICHTLKTSKEYRVNKATPVIFVSAVKEIAGSRFAFRASDMGMVGPDDYIDKPIDPSDLLTRVKMLLEE